MDWPARAPREFIKSRQRESCDEEALAASLPGYRDPQRMIRRHLKTGRKRCLLRQAEEDPDAFADFYDAYAGRVLAFFTRRVLNAETAFDLMSETFAIALERRRQFRGRTPQEEQGWLFAIARSELSHFWRQGAAEKAALARFEVAAPSLTDIEIERIEHLAGIDQIVPKLATALAGLSSEQRRAVTLRVVVELDYDEIAEELGVSEDVARARVSRGLRILRGKIPDVEHLLTESA